MNEKILEVKNLSVSFNTYAGEVKALRDISFHVNKGETLAIVGESGSGKSVTVQTVMKLIPMPPGEIKGGEILFQGEDLIKVSDERMRQLRGGKIGMIFQDPMTSLNPTIKVGKQIMEGIFIHKKVTKEEAKKQAVEMLRKVGIPKPEERFNQYPHEFSGGQRQRIGIARALGVDPEILVCDEPISALDVSIQAQVVNLLKDLQKQRNLTLLFIAHDLSMVKYISDRVAVMYRGKVVELGKPEDVYNNPVHSYTKSLISAVPVADPDFTRHEKVEMEETYLRSPVGDVSEINYIPEESELTEYKPGHFVETSFLLEHKLI